MITPRVTSLTCVILTVDNAAIKEAIDDSIDYEGESNENRKTEIKIRNIAPLSYKLADMLPML
jgi:hypothetical protein